MTTMAELVEIELVGGYFDGQRRRVTEEPGATLVIPIPPDASLWLQPGAALGPLRKERYRRDGIRDDGTRVYRCP